MELALKETFIEMDTMMRTKEGQRRLIEIKLGTDNQSDIEFYNEEKTTAGCTANVALIHKDTLYVANCGDSRSIIYKNGRVVKMSIDHKPDQDRERARVKAAGG